MLIFLYNKSINEKQHEKWRLIAGLLIRKAVFHDNEDNPDATVPLTARAESLMHNRHFRQLVTEELITTKKSLAGMASENLKHLYQQLQLDKYALTNLKSPQWYVKAKAIQELTLMELKDVLPKLYRYTNNKNELVRMEAQSATVQFYGFEGLRFLNVITYPISEWQQIKLLQQLSQAAPVDVSIDTWLRSKNSSVAVFALKLARSYHWFQWHDTILACLEHPEANVRLQAIDCLCEIYTDKTAAILKSRFWQEELEIQLAIVKALRSIGTEDDAPFLVSLLAYDNNEMKIYAARAVTHISKNGLELIGISASASGYPLNEILAQIKGELAV
ncbi:MAG TPA: HEAT repeat domain-containing protein [Mucilaginibacter sp.]|nr:HEAT repeat domain-containing protein [Mucilaginibacter sp.]